MELSVCSCTELRGSDEVLELVSGRHGPGSLHPPHGEGVAQSLVCQVVTAGHLGIHLSVIALQNLVKEVDVTRSEFEDLDFAQFVRRQRRDDFSEWGEGVIQRLCALTFPHISDDSLRVKILKLLSRKWRHRAHQWHQWGWGWTRRWRTLFGTFRDGWRDGFLFGEQISS